MAIIAGIATCYVSWSFSGCCHTVVTRAASTDNLSVINRADRRPDIGVVTVFANITRLDVCEILARRICSVVAANAIIRNVRVVEICG